MSDLLTTEELKTAPKKKPAKQWRNKYLFRPASGASVLVFEGTEADFPKAFEMDKPGVYWAQVSWPSYEIAEMRAKETLDPELWWDEFDGRPWHGIKEILFWDGAYEDG